MSSAQATSPPASRSASLDVPQADERNDEVAGDESAPLLRSEESSTTRSQTTKVIHFLTPLALSSSVLTLLFLIVTSIVMAAIHSNALSYDTSNAMGAVVVPALFSILICSVDSARIRRDRPPAPLAFNILLDFLIAVFVIAYAASGLANLDGEYRWYSPPLALEILAGIALGMAILFGAIHLVLFVVRCRVAYLMDSWSNHWPLPHGQLTFEVSIKFFKEPQKSGRGGEETV